MPIQFLLDKPKKTWYTLDRVLTETQKGNQMQARQGDIFFERVNTIPDSCTEIKDKIIAHGEVTGHKHTLRQESGATLLLEKESNDMFISSTNDFLIEHDEHDNIPLKAGKYKVIRQREYDPISDAKEKLVQD